MVAGFQEKPEGNNMNPDAQNQEAEGKGNGLQTRRRLLQTGLLAVPVIMTVRSRPAFAQALGSAGIWGNRLARSNGRSCIASSGLARVNRRWEARPTARCPGMCMLKPRLTPSFSGSECQIGPLLLG